MANVFCRQCLFDRNFTLISFAKTAGKARAQMARYLDCDMKAAITFINRVRRARILI